MLDPTDGSRWPTFGDLRRKPPSGGRQNFYYQIYRKWVADDPSFAISSSHPVWNLPDPAFGIGDLFVTRIHQTLQLKWELATESASGVPRTPKSLAAEQEFRNWGCWDMVDQFFRLQKEARTGRKRKAPADAPGPIEAGVVSGRITEGTPTHGGLLKPPTPPPGGGPARNRHSRAASPHSRAASPSGSAGSSTPAPTLGAQLAQALPKVMSAVEGLDSALSNINSAVSANNAKVDQLIAFLIGGGAPAAPAATPTPSDTASSDVAAAPATAAPDEGTRER